MTMGLMNKEKEEQKFLDASGHSYIRSKKLNSLSLKDYLTILEQKFVDQASKDDPTQELICVDKFIKLVEEDKDTFLDRTHDVIREAEMTPYEHKQRQMARDAEAKRLKEEAELHLVDTATVISVNATTSSQDDENKNN